MSARVRGANGYATHRLFWVATVKLLAVTALLLSAAPARADPSNGLPTQFRPSFPVFGSGPVVNFVGGDNQAMTNAAAHVGFSLAIPLLGERLWGRKGLWVTGLSWMALSLAQESLFHAPANPGPGYPAEVRSDLITRLLPCATILLFDALRGGGHADMSPSMPPERPGWPIGLEIPRPADEVRPGVRVGDASRQRGTSTRATD